MSILIRHVLLDNKPADIPIEKNYITLTAAHLSLFVFDTVIESKEEAVLPTYATTGCFVMQNSRVPHQNEIIDSFITSVNALIG